MSAVFNDPMFYYGVAFVIFLALAYRYGRKPLLDWLDSEILKIRNELAQARKLRAEAEATLAEYKTKQVAALAQAEAIVAYAKEEAESLRTQAEAELKDLLIKHEKHAAERIRIAEAEAVDAVRAATIDMAMKIARESLATRIDETAAAKLADQAIADMPKPNGAKAKAA